MNARQKVSVENIYQKLVLHLTNRQLRISAWEASEDFMILVSPEQREINIKIFIFMYISSEIRKNCSQIESKYGTEEIVKQGIGGWVLNSGLNVH